MFFCAFIDFCVFEHVILLAPEVLKFIFIPSRSVVWTGEVLGFLKVLQAQFKTTHRSQVEGVPLWLQRREGLPCGYGKS